MKSKTDKRTFTEKLKDRLIMMLGGYTPREWCLCQNGIAEMKKIAIENHAEIGRLNNQVAAGSSDKVRSLEAELKKWKTRAMRAESKNKRRR